MVARTRGTPKKGYGKVVIKMSPKGSPNGAKSAATEEEQGLCKLLESMVNDMNADPSHILPMYTHLQERKAKKTLAEESEATKHAKVFGKLTNFASLDDDFKGSWITKNSDLTADDLVKAIRKDATALDHLCTYACQVGAKQKLPREFQTVEVVTAWMDARHVAAGSRLKTFKAHGGLDTNGGLTFLKGSYRLRFENSGALVGITYAGGGAEVAVDKELGITRRWKLQDNNDDFNAAVVKAPLPPLRLHTLFPADVGPNKLANYHGKPKSLQAEATDLYKKWEAKKQEAFDQVTPSMAVRNALDVHKKQQSAEVMMKARAAAKEKLARSKSSMEEDLDG